MLYDTYFPFAFNSIICFVILNSSLAFNFRGMQTWEYAPQYALRTYAYLLPMAAVAKCFQFLLQWLPPSLTQQMHSLLLLPDAIEFISNSSLSANALGPQDKPLLFAMLRSFLALVSSYSELSFLNAIHDKISPNLAHWTALCSVTAAGNFHAGQAYLPSSSVMILWRLSAANQLKDHHACAIFWGLVAVLAVGWPFCAVLFVSTGFWALWNAGLSTVFVKSTGLQKEQLSWFRPVMHVLTRTLLHAVSIQAIVMSVDFYHYGQILSPIWNIFAYNAQSGGDELYGVEPLSYYVKNLALNFNLVAFLGVFALPLIVLKKFVAIHSSQSDTDLNSQRRDSLKILALIPMYIWMGIVFPRPHKEERFLFPIYPILCFGAAITIDETFDALARLIGKQDRLNLGSKAKLLIGLSFLSPCAIISVSRSFALHHHYSAPLALYQHVHSQMMALPRSANDDGITYVCTAGEWYRFPSSFFLPLNSQLGFLKSSFAGQLPQPFTEFGSTNESLKVQKGKFNDINREEFDRYVNIEQCTYVIELVPSSDSDTLHNNTPESLQYMESDSSAGSWYQLASFSYLNTEATSTLHRILYLPFGRNGKVAYNRYNLYARSLPD